MVNNGNANVLISNARHVAQQLPLYACANGACQQAYTPGNPAPLIMMVGSGVGTIPVAGLDVVREKVVSFESDAEEAVNALMIETDEADVQRPKEAMKIHLRLKPKTK